MQDIKELSRDQLRNLWHMRLGHFHTRRCEDAHHHVDGIPKLPRSDVLHTCPMCARSKLHKADRIPSEDVEPDECWQNIQIDFGFFVQRSSGKKTSASPTGKQAKAKAARRELRMVRTFPTPQDLPFEDPSGKSLLANLLQPVTVQDPDPSPTDPIPRRNPLRSA